MKELDLERCQTINKQIQKQKRQENKKHTLKMLSNELDLRDRWLGIRNLKRPYQPTPYYQHDKDGKHIKIRDRAEAAANFLGTGVWGAHTNDEPDFKGN